MKRDGYRARDSRFGLPASGLGYIAYAAGTGAPLLRGRTDRHGRFDPGAADGAVVVQFFDEAGRSLGSFALGESDELRVPWRDRPRADSTRATTALVDRYDGWARRLEDRAADTGHPVGIAARRLRATGRELDQLCAVLDRALAGDPRALGMLDRLGARVGALELPGRDGLERPAGAFPRAASGPAFIEGAADVFGRLLRLTSTAPSAARALLGALFAINRGAAPLVAALRGRAQPGTDLPIDVTDPYQPEPGGRGGWSGWGGGRGRPGRGEPELPELVPDFRDPTTRQMARCETALLATLDEFDRQLELGRARSGGGAVSTLLSIQPQRQPVAGSAEIEIRAAGRAETIAGVRGVEVSFPGVNGRIQVWGTLLETVEVRDGWYEHVVRVRAPEGNREGVLQVLGIPLECLPPTDPVHDPQLGELLDLLHDCLGMSAGGGKAAGGAQQSSCTPNQLNWLGSAPELHFFVTQSPGEWAAADERVCWGGVSRWIPRTDPKLEGGRTSYPRDAREPLHPLVWQPVPAVERCEHGHDSIPYRLEADQPIAFDLRISNDPSEPVEITVSSPIALTDVVPAEDPIEGTSYLVAWDDPGVIPDAAWRPALDLDPPQSVVQHVLQRDLIGVPVVPSFQVVRAKTGNALGSAQRALEVLRYLETARITRFRLSTPDEPRDLSLDPRVSPDETLQLDLEIEPPTYREFGITFTLTCRLGGETQFTTTAHHPLGSRSSFAFGATLDLRNVPFEGPTTVEVSVSYQYADPTLFPGGVAPAPLPVEPARASVVIMPRIAVLGFTGQWNSLVGSATGFFAAWPVSVFHGVVTALREDGEQKLVARLLVSGRFDQVPVPTDPAIGGRLAGTIEDAFAGETGGFARITDAAAIMDDDGTGPLGGSHPRGCVHFFANEWAFRRGNNELGGPQRDWGDDENVQQVDGYMTASGMDVELRRIIGSGRRKTHLLLLGFSRGGGAVFDIMSWLKRSIDPALWEVHLAAYLDAMHTDGFFQPVVRFPLCAERMINIHATEPSFGTNTNCAWDGRTYYTPGPCRGSAPSCPGSPYVEHAAMGAHGEVPSLSTDGGSTVHDIVRAALVARIDAVIDRAMA